MNNNQIKMGIEGKFKDVGYYNTINTPILPSSGLYLIPNEVYTYKIIEDNKIASMLCFYTGSNIISYFLYPGKIPITSINITEEQRKEVIHKFSTCPIYGKGLTKTIEFLNGDRIGPFEDAILFPENNLLYEDGNQDNPHMISNTQLQFKTIDNKIIISEALQFQSPEAIDKIVSNYIEKFIDNRMQYYIEGRVTEYNEFKEKTSEI
jgi:hypothetical protein